MAIYTLQRIREVAHYTQRQAMTDATIKKAINETHKPQDKFIFISHSHKDLQFIEPLHDFFAAYGVNLYIDSLDPEMAPITSPDTAIRLRKKITRCHKFVLIATDNSGESKWVPWELGFADSTKDIEKEIVIFPIATNSAGWKGNEYIGIYPRIEQTTHTREPVILKPGENNGTTLADWMK